MTAGSASERVEATRRRLFGALVMRALLTGAAAGGTILIVAVLLDMLFPLPGAARQMIPWAAVLTALATATWMARSARATLSPERVALWIEERTPLLGYALVTAIDPAAGSARPRLESEVRSVKWEHRTTADMRRASLVPSLLLALVVTALFLLPGWAVQRVTGAEPGDSLLRPAGAGADRVNPLASIVVSIVPPAYSGERASVLENPAVIPALEGSVLAIRGRSAADISATLEGRALSVIARGDTWNVPMRMPAAPAVVRLTSPGGGSRLLALEPRTDSVPAVVLLSPLRDTVLREPTGTFALRAEARDDLGIASAAFELLVTSGGGELYSFRADTIGRASGGGRRLLSLNATVTLESLSLAAGDVVHIRAFAIDANDVGGPGTGLSETRSIRVARPGEYDSLAIEGAPPPDTEEALLSQRMLIQMTESLVSRSRRLSRSAIVQEAGRISVDQKRLRQRTGEVVFMRLGGEMDIEHAHGPGEEHAHGEITPAELLRAAERASGVLAGAAGTPLDFHGDETPVVAINRPLLEAYNHMWDASRELDVGEPARALPPMHRALEAIQRARQAERVYLRGMHPAIVVDVPAARMQGRDRGSNSVRAPRAPLESTTAARAARVAAAAAALGRNRSAGIDSLLLLRVEVLHDSPVLAALLGAAIDSIRAGRDPREPLAAARRVLLAGTPASDSLRAWSGGW